MGELARVMAQHHARTQGKLGGAASPQQHTRLCMHLSGATRHCRLRASARGPAALLQLLPACTTFTPSTLA